MAVMGTWPVLGSPDGDHHRHLDNSPHQQDQLSLSSDNNAGGNFGGSFDYHDYQVYGQVTPAPSGYSASTTSNGVANVVGGGEYSTPVPITAVLVDPSSVGIIANSYGSPRPVVARLQPGQQQQVSLGFNRGRSGVGNLNFNLNNNQGGVPAAVDNEVDLFKCSLSDVSQTSEFCFPTLVQNCSEVVLTFKKLKLVEFCYNTTRTECRETVEQVENEVCTFKFEHAYVPSEAVGVRIEYVEDIKSTLVTTCDKVVTQKSPSYSYGSPAASSGYGSPAVTTTLAPVATYGSGHGQGGQGYVAEEEICREQPQRVRVRIPNLLQKKHQVNLNLPKLVKTCVQRPILMPTVQCEKFADSKCTLIPEMEDATEVLETCNVSVGIDKCQEVRLNLPQQECEEVVEGEEPQGLPSASKGSSLSRSKSRHYGSRK